MDYDAAYFDVETIDELLHRYCGLLLAMVAGPDTSLSRLPLVNPEEREALRAAGQATRSFAPSETLHARFERRAAERPAAPALTFDDTTLNYGKLNACANRLARRLRALGVGPETRVGIALERSADLVVAILAVLKAGGAYVPLDPAYPAERIAFVLDDAAIPVLVTNGGLLNRLPTFGGVTLRLDTDARAIAREAGENLQSGAEPHHLAYVIYTSGSTGRPKGVQVTHANGVRLFDATEDWFGFGVQDVWTLFHSSAFDFSVWEIWGALLYGGRLVVVPFLTTRSPEDFHRLLVAEGVTVLSQTPSAFKQLTQADRASGVEPSALRLRYVVFGGEALDPPDPATLDGAARRPAAAAGQHVRHHRDHRPAERVRDVHESLIQADLFGRFPLAEILASKGGREPFFATFNFLHFRNWAGPEAVRGGRVELVHVLDRFHLPFNLAVSLTPQGEGGGLHVEYDGRFFSRADVAAALDAYLLRLGDLTKVEETATARTGCDGG